MTAAMASYRLPQPPLQHRPNALVSMRRDIFERHFDAPSVERFATLIAPGYSANLASVEALDDVDVLFTGWGTTPFTPDVLDRMPRLAAVFHCAGSVHGLAPQHLFDRNIRLFSAAGQNARPVAEYTLAAIVMAGKQAPFLARRMSEQNRDWDDVVTMPLGNAGRTVGVIGFSRIGSLVVAGVRQLPFADVLVYDPYADAATVADAGASLVSLEELLRRSDVVTVHAPQTAETQHMLGHAELAMMRTGATLINTARGSLLDHDALLAECRSGRLFAILDVTDPEPLPLDSPLLSLPNVMVTPHVAGSLGTEIDLLFKSAVDSLQAFLEGRATSDEVIPTHLQVSA